MGSSSCPVILSLKLLVKNRPFENVIVLATFAVPRVHVLAFLEMSPSSLLLPAAAGSLRVTNSERKKQR